MQCRIEYTNAKGKRALVAASSQPREFPNTAAAKQYIRNHRYDLTDARPVPKVP